MSDIDSAGPIRTQLPSQVNYYDVITKLGDATNPATQQAAVDTHGSQQTLIADATGAVVTSQANGSQRALDVGINVAGVQIDPRSIRALTAADVVTVQQGTNPWITSDVAGGSATGGTAGSKSLLAGLIYNTAAPALTNGQQVGLQGDIAGNLKVNIAAGSLDVGIADKTTFTYGTSVFQPVGGVFQDTSPTLTAGQSGAARLTANRAVHTNLRTSAGVEITAQTNGSQEALDVGINVLGVQIDPRQIRALTSADVVTAAQGSANTASNAWPIKVTDGTNVAAVKPASTAALATDPALVVAISPNSTPIPVTISALVPGTAIDAYNTASAIAAGATSNHDYTVTAGKTLTLTQIEASSSGKMKIEVQIETGVATGVFNSRFVQFNSTNTPNMSIHISPTLQIAAGVRVRVIRTNRDLLAQDLYSTIGGQEQ
jgi:6,7-dimethyl-8-ribityllumazine synthase